jgi:hypothetical protein
MALENPALTRSGTSQGLGANAANDIMYPVF